MRWLLWNRWTFDLVVAEAPNPIVQAKNRILHEAELSGIPPLKLKNRFSIALLDGALEESHPCFSGCQIKQLGMKPGLSGTRGVTHATMLASILVADGSSTLGLSAGCNLLSIPIVDSRFELEEWPAKIAAVRISSAINKAIDLGARIILLSMAFSPERDSALGPVFHALTRACRAGLVTVVASSNSGGIGETSLWSVPGIIPVTLAFEGRPTRRTVLGRIIALRGLMAPGYLVPGALPGYQPYGLKTGSSYAAAIVAATCARLWSLFPDASVEEIIGALLIPGNPESRKHGRTITPNHLNGRVSYEHLIAERRKSNVQQF